MLDLPPSSDCIFIRNLTFPAIIGIRKKERTTPQIICINLILYLDTQKAAQSDQVTDTVDYSLLSKTVIAYVKKSRFLLLERACHEIATKLLSEYPINRATVSIEKKNVSFPADSVGITITQSHP